MVTAIKWIAILILAALTFMHAGQTASFVWHMYRYDVPGAWIGEDVLKWQYWTAPAIIVGLLVLLKYGRPTERMVCIIILAVIVISFALFLLLHLTDRLGIK